MQSGTRKSQVKADNGMIMGVTLALFTLYLSGLIFTGHIQALVFYVYAAASVISFVTYCVDKHAAEKGAWRVSENSLHMMALCCGWPGALAAQRIIRHKTLKKSFQRIFMACVSLNIAGFVWYAWQA